MNTTHKPYFAYRLPYGKFRETDTESLKQMADAGIRLFSLSTMNTCNSIGEPYNSGPLIWKWIDSYDFSVVDCQIEEILAIVPSARFLLVVDMNSPHWLQRKLNVDSFTNLSECALYSEWKTHVENYRNAFVDHCEKRWAHCVEGYIVACGKTMEWLEEGGTNISTRKLEAYSEWCGKHNCEVLQPPLTADFRKCRHGFYRDPEAEKNVIQWLRFCGDIIADLAIEFIRGTRSLIRPEASIGIFFGSVFHMMANGQTEAERVFREAAPDIMIAAACNTAGDMGLASGYIGTTLTLKRHNIRFLNEVDRMTSTSNKVISEHISLSGGIWGNYCVDTADDLACLKREMAMSLIHNFDLWWFNIWGGIYRSPEVRNLMKKMALLWEHFAGKSTGSNAQILYVYDPESNYYIDYMDHPKQYHLGHEVRFDFALAGVAFDSATWDDLRACDLSQYRLIIFQNLAVMNEERMQIIQKKIIAAGKIFVIHSQAGCIHNGKFDPQFTDRLAALPGAIHLNDCVSINAVTIAECAEKAGVHRYCVPGNAVWHSREFLMVHRAAAGSVTVDLPTPHGKVTEIFTGRLIGSKIKSFTEIFDDTDTRLYYLEAPNKYPSS